MNTHLPYNDKDRYLINEIMEMWKKKGFVGGLDLNEAGNGIVVISTADWINPGARTIHFRLHKIYAGSGLFGDKALWVSELITESKTGGKTLHGCVEGKNQLQSLDRAINEVGYNFISKTKISDYYFV